MSIRPAPASTPGAPTNSPRPSNASSTPHIWPMLAQRQRTSSTSTGAQPMVTNVAKLTPVNATAVK